MASERFSSSFRALNRARASLLRDGSWTNGTVLLNGFSTAFTRQMELDRQTSSTVQLGDTIEVDRCTSLHQPVRHATMHTQSFANL